MSAPVIRIAVLGTANIATRSVIPAILEADKFFLSGIASRDISNAEKVAAPLNIKSYSGYESILDKNAVDAVYIPLPIALHYEWAKQSLEAGLHVLVEKSLACTSEEVRDLNKLAALKKLVLLESFQFRFHRQLQFIKDQISSGRIGALRCLRSGFGFPPFVDKNNIRYQPELGGGALLDAGVYPIKVSQIFLGPYLKVVAANLNFENNYKVDIWGGAYLKQRSGNLFSQVAFGFDHFYQCNLELWGNKGKISANRIFTSPPGHRAEIVIEDGSGKEVVLLEPDNHFKNLLDHFYHLITTGTGVEAEYEENINQANLLDQVRLKAQE